MRGVGEERFGGLGEAYFHALCFGFSFQGRWHQKIHHFGGRGFGSRMSV